MSRLGAALTIAIIGVFGSGAAAQTDEGLLIGSARDEKPFRIEGAALAFPSTKAADSGGRTTFWEFSSEGRLRLDNAHELNPVLGYSLFEFSPGTRVGPVDSDLVDGSFAFATPITTIGEWYIGARAGVGYAGDHPFAESKAWYGIASLSAGRRFDDGDALLLWVDYEGNRTLFPDVPLPHIAYSFSPTPNIDYVLGLPESSVEYRPSTSVKLSIKYDVPFDVEGSVELKLAGPLTAVCSYVSDEHAFHSSQVAKPDRVFIQEQRVEAGLRWDAADNLKLTLLGGYAFGRSVSTGFDDRDRSKVAGMSDGLFLSVGLTLEF